VNGDILAGGGVGVIVDCVMVSGCRYHCITTSSFVPFIEADEQEPGGNKTTEDHVRALLVHSNALKRVSLSSVVNYMLWCKDGTRCRVDMYTHRNCIFLPNHRANAIIDAGRYVTKEFNFIDVASSNQKVKDASGSNYIYGDVVCIISAGMPDLDHSIYGENPLTFLLEEVRTPSETMTSVYGGQLANFMINPRTKKKNAMTKHSTSDLTSWEYAPYIVFMKGDEDEEFKLLLQSWGWS